MELEELGEEFVERFKLNKKKAFLALITILIFFVGMSIAPPPIADGEYTISLSYYDDEGAYNFNLFIPIEIDSDLEHEEFPSTIESTSLDITLRVSYYKQYSGKVGSKLAFSAVLLDNGVALENVNNKNYNGALLDSEKILEFSSTGSDGPNALFQFRVLKNSDVALGILLAISFLWLTELVPLAASSMLIPILIVLFNIDNATGALQKFSEPIIFLFLAGFLMAEAMKRSGLDEYIALKIISSVPGNPKALLLAFMALSAVFSMFMSNTAAVALLIPISIELLDTVHIEDKGYKRTLVLSIAYAATVGGIGTMIGTPPNIIAITFLKEYNEAYDINFLEWLLFGLPVVAIMLPVVFFYLWFRFKPKITSEEIQRAKEVGIAEMKKKHDKITLDQLIVALIFAGIIGMWLTTSLHGISASIVAVMGAVAFFFTGQIKQEDLNRINWNALLTFGGGLSLGYIIIETGLADFIALKFTLLSGISTFLVIVIVAFAALLLTAIASNTASAAILIPIIIPIGVMLGINPILLAVLVSMACSIDFAIVIGTPTTMMAYSTGLYKVKDIFNIGIVLDLVGILVVIFLTWGLFGLFVPWVV